MPFMNTQVDIIRYYCNTTLWKYLYAFIHQVEVTRTRNVRLAWKWCGNHFQPKSVLAFSSREPTARCLSKCKWSVVARQGNRVVGPIMRVVADDGRSLCHARSPSVHRCVGFAEFNYDYSLFICLEYWYFKCTVFHKWVPTF